MDLKIGNKSQGSQNFLAFYLNGKDYAFPILKVNEVIVLPEITPIPKAPSFMKGVINLRGQIIPIIDLRVALNMEETTYDKQTCIIIVKLEINNYEKFVGFIVDSVSEVFEINTTDIEQPSQYVANDFLSGIGKVKDKIIMLLNINEILPQSDTESLMFYTSENCIDQ